MSKKHNIIIFIVVIVIVVISLYFMIFTKERETEKIIKTEVISQYNNPIVPEGFHTIDTEKAKWIKSDNDIIQGWNDGLVIEDEKGNQFVWIPINMDNLSYHRYVSDNSKYIKDNLDINDNDERQIIQYGGFYISRYEAGVPNSIQSKLEKIDSTTNDINGQPVSKKNIIPWNYISYEKARQNAKAMYQNENIQSDLLTQKQYQAVIQWLNTKGYDVYNNSYKFGNYSNVNFEFTGYYSIDYGKNYKYGKNVQKTGNNMILSTGATDRNMTNNIYDLAGNLMEYIISNESNVLCNGGYYDYIAREASCSMAWTGMPSDKVGFRIVLNLK